MAKIFDELGTTIGELSTGELKLFEDEVKKFRIDTQYTMDSGFDIKSAIKMVGIIDKIKKANQLLNLEQPPSLAKTNNAFKI